MVWHGHAMDPLAVHCMDAHGAPNVLHGPRGLINIGTVLQCHEVDYLFAATILVDQHGLRYSVYETVAVL